MARLTGWSWEVTPRRTCRADRNFLQIYVPLEHCVDSSRSCGYEHMKKGQGTSAPLASGRDPSPGQLTGLEGRRLYLVLSDKTGILRVAFLGPSPQASVLPALVRPRAIPCCDRAPVAGV